ncbi:MAG: hypothetical protein IPG51_20970 [Chloroflexi bacterium]|jgi:hypothetical protein|nr:hypothetical protein [Chloroflexota bacterium]
MDSKMTIEPKVQTCDLCRIGRCQPTKAPFIYWVDKYVMVLPNAPAYSCDICGQLQYDEDFLDSMDILLQELEVGLPPERQPTRAVASEKTAQWPSTRSR